MTDAVITRPRCDEIALNKEIGQRIRMMRKQRRLARDDLAPLIEISYQQLQKIEEGTNRCSAGRLMQIAQILNCPIADLFPARRSRRSLERFDPMLQLSDSEIDLIVTARKASVAQRKLIMALAHELAAGNRAETEQ